MKRAYGIFDDLERRGLGRPPFWLGGGTVLMLHYKHRFSIDVDFFGYDAQWISLVTPRLNEHAAALADTYVEQANAVKLVMAEGDIEFVTAGDVTCFPARTKTVIEGREIEFDPPDVAKHAMQAASPKRQLLPERAAGNDGRTTGGDDVGRHHAL
jgi:hypothetical protein